MAITFGAGISFGGGINNITFVEVAGGGANGWVSITLVA